jgi:hypothetical protein
MFESVVTVKVFEEIPVYGGIEYRRTILKEAKITREERSQIARIWSDVVVGL